MWSRAEQFGVQGSGMGNRVWGWGTWNKAYNRNMRHVREWDQGWGYESISRKAEKIKQGIWAKPSWAGRLWMWRVVCWIQSSARAQKVTSMMAPSWEWEPSTGKAKLQHPTIELPNVAVPVEMYHCVVLHSHHLESIVEQLVKCRHIKTHGSNEGPVILRIV